MHTYQHNQILELEGWEANTDEATQKAWSKIRGSAGRPLYIRSAELRAAGAYRAGFTKAGGAWRMNFFVSGD